MTYGQGLRLFRRSTTSLQFTRDILLPFSAELRREHGVQRVRLGIGWRGGPHVILAAGPERHESALWTDAANRLRCLVDEDDERFSVDDFIVRAGALARIERRPLHEDDRVLRPHGHIDIGDFRSEFIQARLSLADLVVGDALESVLPLLVDHEPGNLLHVFAALADSHPYRVGFGAFSLRSHAEAYAHWASSRNADPRPAWESRLADIPADVREDVRARLSERPVAASELARAAFLYALGYADALIDYGKLSNVILDGFTDQGARKSSTSQSAFHERLESLRITQNPPARFASYRLVINTFYSMLPLVDVTPAERYFACYAVSRIVDDESGTSWAERASRTAALRDELESRTSR